MMVPASVRSSGVHVHALRHREHVRLFDLGQLGQAEIENLDLALFVDDDVGGLQIAVHDARAVRGRQSVGDLDRVAQRVIQPHALAADQPVQGLAGHVLHGDEVHRLAIHLAGVDVENRDDVAIAQRRGGFRFLGEARPAVGVRNRGGGQHFDGDRPVQVRVQRAVHHAHPARAQLGFDAIMPESLADHCRILRSERPSYHLACWNVWYRFCFGRPGLPLDQMHRRHFLASLGAAAVPARLWGQAPLANVDFTLRIAPMNVEIAPRKVIKTIAYNGSVPGPLLRMKEGRPVTIEVFNDTGDPEIVHWHGLQIPSAVDGSMEEGTPMLPPHSSARYSFTPAAQRHALVSHARPGWAESETGHLHRAVRILYIEPPSEPGNYDQEVFLALKEWDPYLSSGGVDDDSLDVAYKLFSVNGRALGHGEPIRVKEGQRVLLRILNASATVTRRIAVAGHQFRVVAMDGNPVAVPKEVRTLELGPAERIDAVVEMNQPRRVDPGRDRRSRSRARPGHCDRVCGTIGRPALAAGW